MKHSDPVDAWWSELERLEKVLMCVGPDEVCCEGMTPRQTAILRTLIAHFRAVMETGTVETKLKELLTVRVSQLNHCEY